MASEIRVELVYATADVQALIPMSLPVGATVADALSASGIEKQYPGADFSELQSGIWGHLVTRERVLVDGDRVEIYRPLQLDPKDARRQLASLGLTMGGGAKS